MSELLPCPFCGGESLLRDRYINGVANTKHYIRECRYCKATFAHWFRSIKKANEAWNRRADHLPDATKMVSNADRIRSMSDEELAMFLWEQNGGNRYWKSFEKYLNWLQQPVKEEIK